MKKYLMNYISTTKKINFSINEFVLKYELS